MVSVSLRQEVVWAPARNAIDGLERGVPPWAIPGFRASPGAPAPLAPWDEWVLPPQRPDLFAAKIRRRPTPNPNPTPTASTSTSTSTSTMVAKAAIGASGSRVTEVSGLGTVSVRAGGTAEATSPSLAWRVAFGNDASNREREFGQEPEFLDQRTVATDLDKRATAVDPERSRPEPVPPAAEAATPRQEPTSPTKRLVLFLGLAYLFFAALASGLIWTVYTAPAHRGEPNGATPPEPHHEIDGPMPLTPPREPGSLTPSDQLRPLATPREPSSSAPPRAAVEPTPTIPPRHASDPVEPGLHTRPDGTRYLIMPLPTELAERLRGRAFALGSVR